MQRDELAGWLRLALNPAISAQAARKLLASFGLPSSIFARDTDALAQVVGRACADELNRDPERLHELLDATLLWLDQDRSRREVLTLGDAAYPQALLAIEDPPLMLYRMGLLSQPPQRALAVVGSRNPTPQGLQNARRFSRAFAEAGVTVVSGLALGVDGAAHEGALEAAAADAVAHSKRWSWLSKVQLPTRWRPLPWSVPDWTGCTPGSTWNWRTASASAG